MRNLKVRVGEAIHGKADVIIGKRSLTNEALKEMEERLKRKEIVKVRILKSALIASGLDRRGMAELVSRRLGALLVDVRGRTFILYKPKRSKDQSKSRGEGLGEGFGERVRGSS